jgi:hypothetical protein
MRRPKMPETEVIERALGSVCLIMDRPITMPKRKLDVLRPGSDESYYMLAAYCFDAARKMEYVFKALKPFAERGDPNLAKEIKDHNDQLNAPGLTWEQRANLAESIMIDLFGQIGAEHNALLNKVAGTQR